jgi:hypothetical protein
MMHYHVKDRAGLATFSAFATTYEYANWSQRFYGMEPMVTMCGVDHNTIDMDIEPKKWWIETEGA